MTLVIPDAMPDIVYFLKHTPDVTAYVGTRVFFRIPDPGKEGGFPLIGIHRLAGGIVAAGGDVVVANIDVALSVWHNKMSGYDTVRATCTAVESALWQIDNTLLNPAGQTVCQWARVTNTIDMPDPESGWPRIILDATFRVRGI